VGDGLLARRWLQREHYAHAQVISRKHDADGGAGGPFARNKTSGRLEKLEMNGSSRTACNACVSEHARNRFWMRRLSPERNACRLPTRRPCEPPVPHEKTVRRRNDINKRLVVVSRRSDFRGRPCWTKTGIYIYTHEYWLYNPALGSSVLIVSLETFL